MLYISNNTSIYSFRYLIKKSIAATVPLAKIIGTRVDTHIIKEATKETGESTRVSYPPIKLNCQMYIIIT